MKRSANTHSSQALKEKSRKISITEATASNVAANLGDSSIIPFALALNAQPMHIGILSSFSMALYQISQLFGTKMMERYPRKKIVTFFVLLHAIMWLFTAFIAIAVFKEWFNGFSIWMLIIFYSLLMFFGGISYAPWFSWMGDIVDPKTKGAYFARRNRISGIFGTIAVMIGALFLDYWKTKGYLLLAFAILFSLAFLFKFISFLLLKKQYAPQFKERKKDIFPFFAFIKRFDNFGKFAIYNGFFNFAVMVASPFFNVYMLQELKFSYTTFTIATVSYAIFYLLFLPLAGKFSDRYGNKKLTIITNVFFALTPVLYMFTKSPLSVILLPQLSAGIASAASVISFSNFTYDSVKPEHRSICITYTNIIIGVGTLLGALVGGWIVSSLHPTSMNPYIFVFLVAAVLRGAVALIFLPQIKEVRKVKKIPANSTYNFFFHPAHFLHAESIKLVHLPEKVFTKFKTSVHSFIPV